MKRKQNAHRARYLLLAGIAIAITIGAVLIIAGQAGGHKTTPQIAARSAPRPPIVVEPWEPEPWIGISTPQPYPGIPVPWLGEDDPVSIPTPVDRPPWEPAWPIVPPGQFDPGITQDTPPVVIPVEISVNFSRISPQIVKSPLTTFWSGLAQASYQQWAARVDRIDSFLARHGSPLVGTGAYWVQSASRYLIPPELGVAIMSHESAFGNQCFREKNAGGLMGYGAFESWEEYIDAEFDFLAEHFSKPTCANQCPGYCEGTPSSWLNAVNGFMGEMLK